MDLDILVAKVIGSRKRVTFSEFQMILQLIAEKLYLGKVADPLGHFIG